MTAKLKTVWLITRGTGPSPQKEVVDILNARKSIKDVRQYVQRLHDLYALTLEERSRTAAYNTKQKPIYEAEVHWAFLRDTPKIGAVRQIDRSRSPQIHCGHDPYFMARLVKNLAIEQDKKTGKEIVTWDEK